MRLVLRIFLLAVVIAFSFPALTTTFPQTPPAEAGLRANPVYVKNCAKCHGKTAEGRHFGGPSLISPKTAAASTEDSRNIIANGKGRMPKFAGKLTAAEIESLVSQIQALNQK